MTRHQPAPADPDDPVEPYRRIVRTALGKVAPEVDVSALDPDRDLQDEAGLDSMDVLNLVVEVFDTTGIEIPERDYPYLSTLGGFADYLAARAGAAPGPPGASA